MKNSNNVTAGLVACILISMAPGPGFGAGPGVSLSPQDTLATIPADTLPTDSLAAEKGHWVGFPVAFYTPETGFGGGAALGYIFPRLGDRHPSSLLGIGFYTEKNQTVIALIPELYLESGFHGLVEMEYQKFPDSYWGIGPDTEDDDEEKYTPELMEARLLAEFEVHPGLRLGGQYRYRREVMLEKEEDGKLQDRNLPGSQGATIAGIGVLGSYDSRDNRFSSQEGWYLFLSYTSYGRTVFSDYPYNSLMLDVRKFIPVFDRHVFATRFYSRNTWGTIPFQDMPYLGGPNSMRGYQAGRYRDKLAAYAQAEYRVPLIWVTSLAVFGSIGNVSDNIGSFSFDSVKYAGGAGIRFRLNEQRFMIRFDYAVTGEGGSNFYVSANEAF
jgi:hypothetical protein